ncbi:E3 ubiquitin-protein ligase [Morus notabilis]|uniref:RING-type E3 ubiquitin transferase n=1 Tax=Morus notabilis TaxID=981085 RepID=W9SWW6_9ROSA|nr:E3 ubiquitin-protein ligase RNF168 [Morus notabilis]EXC31386.1 E3 ubiquitin-protein ligase [Morus notabilis]
MGSEDRKQSPRDPRKNQPTESGFIFSPRFKSVAAMAGWDEDSLLCASLIVDDTPDRDSRRRKRTLSQFNTPPSSNSRRKRRAQQRSPISIPMVSLDLDDGATTEKEATPLKEERKETGGDISLAEQNSGGLPCMDKLREELSCAICLDICLEPSTTPCGHSFCLKCLRSAASKCGKKCPKCRQVISNGRSCTVNTVLWNTIQLLFPKEVEAKKSAGASKGRESERNQQIPEMAFYNSLRNEGTRESQLPSRTETIRRRRRAATQSRNDDTILSPEREMRRIIRAASRVSSSDTTCIPSQDEDAALALRLQREEFMGAFRGTTTRLLNQSRTSTTTVTRGTRVNQSSTTTNTNTSGGGGGGDGGSSSFSLARANLRAMASRAVTLRVRDRYNI